MSYNVSLTTGANKELKKLDKAVQIQIINKIRHLKENPELGEPLSNILKNKWRLHIGKWRVVYSIEGNTVLIAKIEHRKGVYR
jgi:mRNA interferase RelE/StbE